MAAGRGRSAESSGSVSERKKEYGRAAAAAAAVPRTRPSSAASCACGAPQSDSRGAMSTSTSDTSSYQGARRAYTSRGGVPRSGRLPSEERYASMSSIGLKACTTGQWAARTARAAAVSTMPPPVAITVRCGLERSTSTRSAASRSRKTGQPCCSTAVMMAPCLSTYKWSRSTHSHPRARAADSPKCVLPAPRIPTITMDASADAPAAAAPLHASGGGTSYDRPSLELITAQNSGKVLSTQSFCPMVMPGSLAPSTAKDMAMRWSLWHAMVAGRGAKVAGSTPVTHMPSSSSPASMPSLPSSDTMTAIRLHSLTRWFAIPVTREVPSATAITATAVMKASVSGSMSTSTARSRCDGGGPLTVVLVPSCCTAHPISPSSAANLASPWIESAPTVSAVTFPPVIAAIASGYVAEEASASTWREAGLA
mmetsp:Transcript_13308/g.44369  ORF Transcript_13308/g.44369 Transcript_13308/m.44369 type:complete len:425 (+) Transcript_13308:1896-3170(+)